VEVSVSRVIATFQLLVSVSWVLGLARLFATLASIPADVQVGDLAIYWGSLLSGPLLLMAASIILILDRRGRVAAGYVALLAAMVLAGLSLFWIGPAFVRFMRQGDLSWAAPLGCFIVASLLSAVAACIQIVVLRRLRNAAAPTKG
jgi:hypothetical protein